MSFQAIRAHIETRVNDAFKGSFTVVFDNTYETPPDLPYVVCLISFSDTTIPTVCVTDGAVEQINGNLQLSVYTPRGQGMKALESAIGDGMRVMNNLFDWGSTVQVKAGPINGPTPVLSGSEPYSVATVSCAFKASVD